MDNQNFNNQNNRNDNYYGWRQQNDEEHQNRYEQPGFTFYNGSSYQQNGSSYYNPFEEPDKRSRRKKSDKKDSFGKKLAKCAALAVVFGLISGSVMPSSLFFQDWFGYLDSLWFHTNVGLFLLFL